MFFKQGVFCGILMLFLPLVQASGEEAPYYYGLELGSANYGTSGAGDPAFAMYLGQRLGKKISIEGGYTTTSTASEGGVSANASLLYAGALLNLPLNAQARLGFFFTGGLSSWYYKAASERDSATGIYFGLGVLYVMPDALSLRVSLKRYSLTPTIAGSSLDEDITFMGLGLQYRP